MRLVIPSRVLKFALTADALASGAVAVLQLAAASQLHPLLQLSQALLVETGVFLVAYTLLLIVLARSERVPVLLFAALEWKGLQASAPTDASRIRAAI